MSISQLPEIDDIILYQLDYHDLYNTCLSSSHLHQYCLNNTTLKSKLKAYNIYKQLESSLKRVEFLDVDKQILKKYGIQIPDYQTQKELKIKVTMQRAYDGIVVDYKLYYLHPDQYGHSYFSGGKIYTKNLNLIDFIHDMLLSSKKLEINALL
jgi:hypothetical protein